LRQTQSKDPDDLDTAANPTISSNVFPPLPLPVLIRPFIPSIPAIFVLRTATAPTVRLSKQKHTNFPYGHLLDSGWLFMVFRWSFRAKKPYGATLGNSHRHHITPLENHTYMDAQEMVHFIPLFRHRGPTNRGMYRIGIQPNAARL
jgi:hypothetical protein